MRDVDCTRPFSQDKLPSDFDHWSTLSERGGGATIAHEAAISRKLPANYTQWLIATNNGWTVAHEALRYQKLPSDFNAWAISNELGWTVAHEAAQQGRLPDDFSEWGLMDSRAESVLYCMLIVHRYDNRLNQYFFDKWLHERPLCKTEADWMVFKTEFPDIYNKYAISEGFLHDEVTYEAGLL
jgi:hypothetical protein